MKLSIGFIFLLIVLICYALYPRKTNSIKNSVWKINTSNLGKFEEFKRLFRKHNATLEATHIDLPEIEADPIQVVAHKASQLEENVIIEDTSLDIEGAKIGINIRSRLDNLNEYLGQKAEWTVLLAYRRADQIYIYKGSTTGVIVEPSGHNGFGFDPVFLPDGSITTLAEYKPDVVNARAKAVEALSKGNVWKQHPMIKDWDGPWQSIQKEKPDRAF